MGNEERVIKEERGQTALKVPKNLTKLYVRVVSPYIFGIIVLSVSAVLLWGWTVVRSVQNRYLEAQFGEVIVNTYPIVILLIVMMGTVGIMLVNTLARRISGQIYRLERDILSVASGKETEIKLRHGDELGRIANAINEVIRFVKSVSKKEGV